MVVPHNNITDQFQLNLDTIFIEFIDLIRQNPTPTNPYYHFLPKAILANWNSQLPHTKFTIGWTMIKTGKTDGSPADFVSNVLNKLNPRHMLRDPGFMYFVIQKQMAQEAANVQLRATVMRLGAISAFHTASNNTTSSFHHLDIRPSTLMGAGKGLFSIRPIPKGAVIGVFTGMVTVSREIEYHNNEDPTADYALAYKSLTSYYEHWDKNQNRITLCDDLKESGLKAFLKSIDPATFAKTFPATTTQLAVEELRSIVQTAYDTLPSNMVADPIFANTSVFPKDQQLDVTGSNMWYVNQPLDGQLTTIGVLAITNVEIRDPDGWKHLATGAQLSYIHLPVLVATHDIVAGQELFTHYNKVDGTF